MKYTVYASAIRYYETVIGQTQKKKRKESQKPCITRMK